MRKWKQRIAAVLTVAMTTVPAMSALAGGVGVPSMNGDDIEVTFDAGDGVFTWQEDGEDVDVPVATDSDADTPVASGSDAEVPTATDSDADTSPIATPSNVEKKIITRSFSPYENDEDGYYVYLNDPVYSDDITDPNSMAPEDLLEKPENAEFDGWYYNLGKSDAAKVDPEATKIYSDVTLTAGWNYGGVTIQEIDGLATDHISAVGLDAGDKITFSPADVEIEQNEKVASALEDNRWTDAELFAIDIESSVSGKPVTIALPIPEGFAVGEGREIGVLHMKDNGEVETIEANVDEEAGLITFTATSFSPYVLVNYTGMYRVRIENVENGYIIAEIDDWQENKVMYFPINEDVYVPGGTEIYLNARGVGKYVEESDAYCYGNWCGEFTLLYDDGTSEAADYGIQVNQNMTITTKFDLVAEGNSGTDNMDERWEVSVDPDVMDQEGEYNGRVTVWRRDPETNRYNEITDCKVSLATEEELEELGADDYWIRENDNDLFVLNGKRVESTDFLIQGSYRLAFVIEYDGKRFLPDYPAYINVGKPLAFYLGFLTKDGMYSPEYAEYLEWDYLAGIQDKTWADAEAFYEKITYRDVVLLNYETQDGWQDYRLKEYAPTDKIGYTDQGEYEYGGYMRFVNDQGEAYRGPEIMWSDEVKNPENPENPSDPETPLEPETPNHSGSGSGSESGSYTGRAASESGKWIQSADGRWWFAFNIGGYPSDGWKQLWWNGKLSWYAFDKEGWMITGWFDWNGKRYYLHPISDGTMGHMYTGWHLIDSVWYYFDESGALLVNTTTPDGYQVGANGAWIQ